MIAGYLQNKLVAQANIQSLGNDMLATMDRRSISRVAVAGGYQQQQASPLDLVIVTSKMPQFQFDQRNDQLIKQIQNIDYSQQILTLATPPDIEIVKQIKDQAKVISMHYSN